LARPGRTPRLCPAHPPGLRRLGRGNEVRPRRPPGTRPQVLRVRRHPVRRQGADRLQAVRDRVHARDPDGRVHGVLGGRLRRALQLRPLPRRCRAVRSPAHPPLTLAPRCPPPQPPTPARSTFATATSTSATAPAADPWRSSSPTCSCAPSTTRRSPAATMVRCCPPPLQANAW